jgi:hypothetical protein
MRSQRVLFAVVLGGTYLVLLLCVALAVVRR